MVWLKKHLPEFSLFAILLAAAVLMYARAFITDDAFISFAYARNFAEGNGLTWHPGSGEYGYTSFLFTLLVGLLMKFGVDVPVAAYIISVPAAFFGIIFTYKIARLMNPAPAVALLAAAALASNPTYAAYATSGLETALAICLVLAVYYYALRWHRHQSTKDLWILSFYSALALLTRLDMALLLSPIYCSIVFVLAQSHRQKQISWEQASNYLIRVTALPVAAVLCLLLFCFFYYGQALPTTAYAKAASWHVRGGLNYLHTFLKAQYYLPVALLVLGCVTTRKYNAYRMALFSAVLLWGLYNLRVGGDFMEFRFILPMLPFFYLLVFDLISNTSRFRNLFFAAGIGLALTGNALQPLYFKNNNIDNAYIESTKLLDHWITDKKINWPMTGQKLRELFYTGSEKDVKIAVTAAGAIPYYSGLPSIDLHGLNTRAVFANARPFLARPGHRLKARLGFLRKAGVNLVIDHPLYLQKAQAPGKRLVYNCQHPSLWFIHNYLWHIPVIFIPLSQDYYLLAHYLAPHALIDERLASGDILDEKSVKKQIRCNLRNDATVMQWLKSP